MIPTRLLYGPLGPFRIPLEPQNTSEHARWVCEMVWQGEYDDPRLPEEITEERPVRVVDVGSHCGAFAVWAAKKWGAGALEMTAPHWTGGSMEVDCYDPIADACELCQVNAPFARVHNVAVTTDPAPRLAQSWDWGSAKTHEIVDGVPVTPLHPRDLPACDVFKCDAEGVEPDVLGGYMHWDDVQVLLYEFHNVDHRQVLWEMATARGFHNLREQADGTYGSSIWVRK